MFVAHVVLRLSLVTIRGAVTEVVTDRSVEVRRLLDLNEASPHTRVIDGANRCRVPFASKPGLPAERKV